MGYRQRYSCAFCAPLFGCNKHELDQIGASKKKRRHFLRYLIYSIGVKHSFQSKSIFGKVMNWNFRLWVAHRGRIHHMRKKTPLGTAITLLLRDYLHRTSKLFKLGIQEMLTKGRAWVAYLILFPKRITSPRNTPHSFIPLPIDSIEIITHRS